MASDKIQGESAGKVSENRRFPASCRKEHIQIRLIEGTHPNSADCPMSQSCKRGQGGETLLTIYSQVTLLRRLLAPGLMSGLHCLGNSNSHSIPRYADTSGSC